MLAHLANAVTAFVAEHGLDRAAETSLRALPPELQQRVLSEGPPTGSNPSAVLTSRIRSLEAASRDGTLSSPGPAQSALLSKTLAVAVAPHGLAKYEAAAKSSTPSVPKVQAEPLMQGNCPKADGATTSSNESVLQQLHREVHRKAISKGVHRELKVRLCLPHGHPTPKGMTTVPPGATVFMLKKQIEEEFRIRSETAALEFSGRSLREGWVLTDCGVNDGGLIHVVPRAPATVAPPKTLAPCGPPPRVEPKLSPEERRSINAHRPLDDEDSGVVAKDTDATFLVYASVQDEKLVSVVARVRQIVGQHFTEDYVGRISMSSGYRLTLLVKPGQTELADVPLPMKGLGKGQWKGIWKGMWQGLWTHRQHLQSVPKQSAVLGVMIYRFRQNVINVVQIAIADEHRDRGLGRKAVEWLVQYAKKFNMDSVALSSTPEGVPFYESCGLKKQVGLKALDGEDHVEGRVLMDYRLTPSPFELALKVAAEGSPLPREELVPMVFTLLDQDGDGHLDVSEMRNFANRIGFTGSDDAWADEYKKVCLSSEGGPETGVDGPLFAKLVNDRSDEGCFCTDDELRNMVIKLMPKEDTSTAGPAQPAMSRKELVDAVFRMCDRDGDGLLNAAELRIFGSHTGFDGDDEAWAEEYRNLCAEVSANTNAGVNLAAFSNMVDDHSESGCYCTDAELHTMLQVMKADRISEESNRKASSFGAQPKSAPSAPRIALLKSVFELCDADRDGYLNESETRVFAGLTGYEGSREQWSEDFTHLCKDLSADGARGVNLGALEKLVNDSSEGGLYCSDEELQSIRTKLEMEAASNLEGQRSELIRAVFKGCDFDGDGHLSELEMRIISNHLGFEGSDEQWGEEFGLLCSDNRADRSRGVDLALAEKLLNDRTDSGCYCNDEELRTLLAKLEDPDEKAKLLPKPKRAAAVAQSANSDPSLKESLRSDIINAVFRACDVDRDGQLNQQEMRGFAQYTGFEGSDEEWSKEYRSLCADKGSAGVDAELFEKLVDDKSDSGCYCTYEELKAILEKLRLDIKNSAGADRTAVVPAAASPPAAHPPGAAPPPDAGDSAGEGGPPVVS